MNYLSQSEENEENLEIFSRALYEIFDIVNNEPMNIKNWNKIRRIVSEADREANL
jgi:hypothetical protein